MAEEVLNSKSHVWDYIFLWLCHFVTLAIIRRKVTIEEYNNSLTNTVNRTEHKTRLNTAEMRVSTTAGSQLLWAQPVCLGGVFCHVRTRKKEWLKKVNSKNKGCYS